MVVATRVESETQRLTKDVQKIQNELEKKLEGEHEQVKKLVAGCDESFHALRDETDAVRQDNVNLIKRFHNESLENINREGSARAQAARRALHKR